MLLLVLAIIVTVPILASPTNTVIQRLADYVLVLLAAMLAGILVMRSHPKLDRHEILVALHTGVNLPVLLFLGMSALSALFTPPEARRFALFSTIQLTTGALLYFTVVYHIRRSEHLTKILDALTLVAVVMAVLSLIRTFLQILQVRVILLGDSQLFSALLMILFPITLVGAFTEKEPKRQPVRRFAAALTGLCLILTGTATAWYGAITQMVELALLSLIAAPARQLAKERRNQYIVPLLLILTCGGIFAALGGAGQLLSSHLFTDETTRLSATRIETRSAAIAMFRERPLFGHGLGSFAVTQDRFRTRVSEGQQRPLQTLSLSDTAHSFWLQLAAEQGITGVLLFGSILVTFLLAGVRRLFYLESGIRRSLLLVALASLVGFAIDAIGNPAWLFPQVSLFFWLFLGLGVSALRPRT